MNNPALEPSTLNEKEQLIKLLQIVGKGRAV